MSKSAMTKYAKKNLVVSVLGSHSALEICQGSKQEGLKNLVVCQKGRELPYSHYYLTSANQGESFGCIDEVVVLDHFKDILQPEIQELLLSKQAIFVPHRSFEVYVCQNDYSVLATHFRVPIFGNRELLQVEERTGEKNQYFLLSRAGIPHPKRFANPQQIDRLVLVKVNEATRKHERAFFLASSPDDFWRQADQLLSEQKITERDLKQAVIEEFIIGPTINLNFFYSPIYKRLELIGTDTRRQTNIDGYVRLTIEQQKFLQTKNLLPSFEEAGHVATTIIESMLQAAFELGEKFVSACQQEFSRGVIGPFALQCVIRSGPPQKEFVVYDISLRMPGSPGIKFTPYSEYLFGRSVSMGQRVAMEIKKAQQLGALDLILT